MWIPRRLGRDLILPRKTPQQHKQADAAGDERHCAEGVIHRKSMAQVIVKRKIFGD
jgi:hypothetical protein